MKLNSNWIIGNISIKGITDKKKEYEAPKAEKVEFDYQETVTASDINYNDDPNGQYYKCIGSTYYSAGWGQNC